MAAIDAFMPIIPRHQKALSLLRDQKQKDILGGIGWNALREKGEPFTLEQIAAPLLDRGLIEDLTATELGNGGKFFVRITPLGLYCLGLGYMLKNPRITTETEMKNLAASQGGNMLSAPQEVDDDEQRGTSGGEDAGEQGSEAANTRDACSQNG